MQVGVNEFVDMTASEKSALLGLSLPKSLPGRKLLGWGQQEPTGTGSGTTHTAIVSSGWKANVASAAAGVGMAASHAGVKGRMLTASTNTPDWSTGGLGSVMPARHCCSVSGACHPFLNDLHLQPCVKSVQCVAVWMSFSAKQNDKAMCL